jgi:hypothetical protein
MGRSSPAKPTEAMGSRLQQNLLRLWAVVFSNTYMQKLTFDPVNSFVA